MNNVIALIFPISQSSLRSCIISVNINIYPYSAFLAVTCYRLPYYIYIYWFSDTICTANKFYYQCCTKLMFGFHVSQLTYHHSIIMYLCSVLFKVDAVIASLWFVCMLNILNLSFFPFNIVIVFSFSSRFFSFLCRTSRSLWSALTMLISW